MIHSLIPKKSPLCLDVMVNGRHYTTIKMPVTVGLEYDYVDLKIYALFRLPSLAKKEFSLAPTASPVYRS